MRILFFLLFFIVLGCTEVVDKDRYEFDTVPVINAVLVEGEPFSINISLAGDLDSIVLTFVNNAQIDLYVDKYWTEKMEFSEDGFYTSKATVESGKEYQCTIVIPNFDTIFCRQNLPVSSPILKVKHIRPAGIDDYGDSYASTIVTFKNETNESRYYEISTRNSTINNRPSHLLHYSIQTMAVITDPVLLNEGLPIALFSNESIEDSIYTMTLNYSVGSSTSYSFLVELRSVTYDYYSYQKQYYLYGEGKYGDITTKATAFPLYSNIENGYGIFAGYSISVSDTITPASNDID
jgi:hypothetical protein